jgi:hypothetical protein
MDTLKLKITKIEIVIKIEMKYALLIVYKS